MQYIPNKPYKFGIKFLLFVDTKLILNGFPRPVKNERANPELNLSENNMKLTEPYLNKSRITDNFFVSIKLAEMLKS